METIAELQSLLKRLEAKWDSGNLGSPQEIVRLDRQIREIKKQIRHLHDASIDLDPASWS